MPSDHRIPTLAVLATATTLALSASNTSSTTGASAAQKACQYLSSQLGNATHFPNSSIYQVDNTDFWSQASALGPACDFAPSCAEDLGLAVNILRYFDSPFAIRGGGHMPIAGYNNIDSSGVLLSSSGFTQLSLAPDGNSVHIGPANHWEDVYKFLEPYGKVVVGGRLGIVGVPGYVTGGGISFFSAQYGWASNNVVSHTVVLADGSVARVTPNNTFADLFWALRGGGNSFALVTDLELKTYDKPVVSVGIATHGHLANSSQYYKTVVDFALNGQTADKKASVIPIVNTGNVAPYNSTLSYTTYRFWDGNTTETYGNSTPPSLTYFTAPNLPVISDTFAPKTMHGWSEETAPQFTETKGLRERVYTPLTLRVVDQASAVKALGIIHDAYYDNIFSALKDLDIWFTGLSPFPMSERALAASAHANPKPAGLDIPFGDPMGIKAENLIVIELSLTFNDNATYEEIVTNFFDDVNTIIRQKFCDEGLDDLISPWIYINDADKGQDVFGGYPKDNVKALQRIRDKYDPERIFTDQMPGGWKVADVAV